jgi:hypothetical protein
VLLSRILRDVEIPLGNVQAESRTLGVDPELEQKTSGFAKLPPPRALTHVALVFRPTPAELSR